MIVADLRAQERQAAEELGQWKTHREERKAIDASQAAITLALLLTDGWTRWRRVLEVEKSRGADDQVEQMSQAPSRLRAMVSLPKYSPPMARPPDGRPRMDGGIFGSQSLRGKRFGRRLTDRSR